VARVLLVHEDATCVVPREPWSTGFFRARAVIFAVGLGDPAAILLVAAHGAGGAFERECDYWRRLTPLRSRHLRLFLLCEDLT
jgi:hypothetical protein